MKTLRLMLTFFIFATNTSAFCQQQKQNPVGITLSPYYKITNGKIEEYIYSSRNEAPVSYLEWELSPLHSFGLFTDLRFFNAHVAVSADVAIPATSGKMYDSDYNEYTGVKHTYSIHEENAILNTSFTAGLSYDFYLSKSVSISPVILAQYDYNSFTARNGKGWYGSSDYSDTGEEVAWNNPAAHYYPDGRYRLGGIDYKRHELYTFFGPAITLKPTPHFESRTEFLISPFTYVSSFDTHLNNRGGTHYQEISWVYFKRFKLVQTFKYKINQHIAPSLTITAINGPVQKGEFYAEIFEDDTNLYLLKQKSGARTRLITARLALDITL